MRTLLAEPRALLLDEPFGKLDSQLRQRVRRFVLDHARESGLPSLLVTHDRADAEAAGGPVIGLPHREEMVAKVLPLRNSTLRAALLWLA
jgi:putative thiamine transport system ATP-binding protein